VPLIIRRDDEENTHLRLVSPAFIKMLNGERAWAVDGESALQDSKEIPN
jgi:hypothetical protein